MPGLLHKARMEKSMRYDVVIVGGGFAGMLLATILGETGVSVAVVEPRAEDNLASRNFDGRTTAIAPSSQRMFEVLGIWDKINPNAQAIRDIRVADQGSPFFVHYSEGDLGAEALGWVAENWLIRRAINEKILSLPSVKIFWGVEVRGFECTEPFCEASLSDGTRLQSRLLVGADGRRSQTRKHLGISTTEWNYNQHAIVFSVRHERAHEGVAIEHFLKSGPFAILPLTGNRSSIVWTERATLASHFLRLDEEQFLEEASIRFGDFLGELTLEGPRWAYPLSLMNAHSYVAPRVALVADAAHTIHPIAGQGINIGWRDVAALGEVIIETMRLGLDPGSLTALNKYQKWRRPDNVLMLATTDLLNRLFSNDVAPLIAARNLGLGAVQRLPRVKKFFMRHAMGDVGELPLLNRGLPI